MRTLKVEAKLLIYLLNEKLFRIQKKISGKSFQSPNFLHGCKHFSPILNWAERKTKEITKLQSWKNPNHNNMTWEGKYVRQTHAKKRRWKFFFLFSLLERREIQLSHHQHKAFSKEPSGVCLQGKEVENIERFPDKAIRASVHENASITGFSFLQRREKAQNSNQNLSAKSESY